jgi:hypothetical protein
MRASNLQALERITLRELEDTLDDHTREMVPVTVWTAFSWSISRHSLFARCLRQYYLYYYGSRRVREAGSELVSAIWWLKQVTPLRQWVGTTVHSAAQWAVRAHRDGEVVGEGQLVERAVRAFREGVQASERGTRHGNRWVVLYEHVYPDEPFTIDRDAAEGLVADLTRTLLESETLVAIRRLPPEALREVDEPFQHFFFDDIKTFAIPDVLLEADDRMTIIDWKTGDVTDEMIPWQAGVYRVYTHHTYGYPEEAIDVLIAELADAGQSAPPVGGLPTLAETEAFIRASMKAMIDKMENVDYHTVSISDFPMTDNIELCQRCAFKRACWRHEMDS